MRLNVNPAPSMIGSTTNLAPSWSSMATQSQCLRMSMLSGTTTRSPPSISILTKRMVLESISASSNRSRRCLVLTTVERPLNENAISFSPSDTAALIGTTFLHRFSSRFLTRHLKSSGLGSTATTLPSTPTAREATTEKSPIPAPRSITVDPSQTRLLL